MFSFTEASVTSLCGDSLREKRRSLRRPNPRRLFNIENGILTEANLETDPFHSRETKARKQFTRFFPATASVSAPLGANASRGTAPVRPLVGDVCVFLSINSTERGGPVRSNASHRPEASLSNRRLLVELGGRNSLYKKWPGLHLSE